VPDAALAVEFLHPAAEPAKGPFYDEIDPEKAPIIREVFERIAAGETSAEVGEWLDSIKFAKAKWSRQSKWTTYNVNSIIRRTIYRGFETNRVKVEKRKLRTGKSQPVWNDEDKIQTRESPHLRIVSDHLWYKANEVVDPAGEPAVMLQRTLVVNAFAEPQLVKHACVIVQRRLEGKTYKEIAKELDLTKDHIQNCARITKLMEEAGLPEPYHRLTEKPDRVPQWCSKHWLKAGDRKGGGKRRRAS
jgi:DNA-directed RNA polymerase specialized sigma24 family protein